MSVAGNHMQRSHCQKEMYQEGEQQQALLAWVSSALPHTHQESCRSLLHRRDPYAPAARDPCPSPCHARPARPDMRSAQCPLNEACSSAVICLSQFKQQPDHPRCLQSPKRRAAAWTQSTHNQHGQPSYKSRSPKGRFNPFDYLQAEHSNGKERRASRAISNPVSQVCNGVQGTESW